MRDDEDESDPNITAPHRRPVTPRTLFDEQDDRAGPGGSGAESDTEGDDGGEGAQPFPITAILLVAVIACVLGYVAVRQFLSPASARPPALAAGAPPPAEEPGPASAPGAAGGERPSRPDYFDPLVPAGGAEEDSPDASLSGEESAGAGDSGDQARETDMVPVEPDIPPEGIGAAPSNPVAPSDRAAPVNRAAPGAEAEAAAEAKRGDYARAARLWAGALSAGIDPGSWTVQVSANCDTSTLGRLLDALSGPGGSSAREGGAFLLPVTIDGRSCYRVCRGIYPDRPAAEAALAKLPRLSPPPQPRCVPLDDLLTR